jgi:polyhydroxybutyrate depolymerase
MPFQPRKTFARSAFAAWFVAGACGVSSAGAGAIAGFLPTGDHTILVNHADRERAAIVHVPPGATVGRALPVVVNFHGGGGHGRNQQEYSLMDRAAEREKFVAIYPNGSGRLRERLLTWNAGTCCGYAASNKIDDIGFIRALIYKVSEILPIDRRRIYATGLSNGGMMAHRLAAEAADLITAVAPVAGGIIPQDTDRTRAVPVMHIHSVDDPRALYGGGLGPRFPLTNNRVRHPDIEQMMLGWARRNGCRSGALEDRRVGNESRGHNATRYVFARCRDDAEVALWKLTGAGHVWPGGKQKFLEHMLGPSTDIIDANTEMWRFFQRFALKNPDS